MSFLNTDLIRDIFPTLGHKEAVKKVKRWSSDDDRKRIAFNRLKDTAKGQDGSKIKLWDVRQGFFKSDEGMMNSHLELFAATKGLNRQNMEMFVSYSDAYVRHAQDNNVPYDICRW